MNRIVLIGNGFDLAHGMKTSYPDFINWYWNGVIQKLKNHHSTLYKDSLCELISNDFKWNEKFSSSFIDKGYALITYFKQFINNKIRISPLLEKISTSIESKGWVDIEREYYTLLKTCGYGGDYSTPKGLNNDLDALKLLLHEYLSQIQIDFKKQQLNWSDMQSILKSPIRCKDTSIGFKNTWYSIIEQRLEEYKIGLPNIDNPYDIDDSDKSNVSDFINVWNQQIDFMGIDSIDENKIPNSLKRPSQTLLLDFNYTDTTTQYCKILKYISINHIHGSLANESRMIFGYGDELDESYKELMKEEDSEFMKNIKSIKYTETANYRDLLAFAESAPYQILILGHSCGKSDGTLLNTLFEHKNCISIKPYYYYDSKHDTDNYAQIVQNIARNFSDMKKMRDLVVNQTYCEQIPQADSSNA